MELVFRHLAAGPVEAPTPGELYMIAADATENSTGMASRVLEKGWTCFPRGAGPVERIVLRTEPTFDDLLAATLVQRLLAGLRLPEGCGAFARYAELGRQGQRPGEVPFEDSLEGIYLAIRLLAGSDLTDPATARRFVALWNRLAESIVQAADAGFDPCTTPLVDLGPEITPARALLERDRRLYLQDVRRGEQWLVSLADLPSGAAGLLLRQPKSLLFQHWCFSDQDTPTGQPYAFLAVQGKAGQWLLCTNPKLNLSLNVLADRLRQAELARPEATKGERLWRDQRAFDRACPYLIAAPRGGSALPDAHVLEIIQQWSSAKVQRGSSGKTLRRLLLGGLGAVATAALLTWWIAGGTQTPQVPREGTAEVPSGRGFQLDREIGTTTPAAAPRANLHLVAVGVSNYRDPRYRLAYADADARMLVEAFRKQEASLFGKVHPTLLADERATREGILEALHRLKGQVHQHDFVLVTLSGHGANLEQNNHFYFLPHDFDENKKATTGVYWDDFKRFLGSLPCRVLLVVDTCHSGTITLGLRGGGDPREELSRQIQKAIPSAGGRATIVMAACLSGGQALENAEWGHGVLTLALLEGIQGRYLYESRRQTPLPTPDAQGEINLKDLDYYASRRVLELAGSAQAVVTNHSGDVALDRIPIARIK